MDWDSRSSTVFQSDVDNVAKYAACQEQRRSCAVAKILKIDADYQGLKHGVKGNDGMAGWLNELATARKVHTTKGVYVIFAPRATSNTPTGLRDPQVLIKFPWTKPTFEAIAKGFLVNISIIRTLNRPASTFMRTSFEHTNTTNPLISYNIRDYTEAASDLGMSVTYDPTSELTYVVVYGCLPAHGTALSDTDQFLIRLSHCGSAYLHPLLLPGLLVEIQRVKHVELVRNMVLALEEFVINLSDNTLGKGHDKENAAQDGVDHWLEASHYRVKLESWKAQLSKMIEALDELDVLYYGKDPLDATKVRNQTLLDEGKRIRERLQDIVRDYEDMVRKCERVIEGTNLANGTAWNHLARQDNTQMKSIALLTMVFLPATFVATFFAMPLLKWDADSVKGEEVYNKRMKYYWIAAMPLTVVVVSMWYCLAVRTRLPKKKADAYTV